MSHVGAAVCVLGLSVLGDPTAVARADDGDPNTATRPGGATDQGNPGPARGQRSAASRAAEAADAPVRRPGTRGSSAVTPGERPQPAATARGAADREYVATTEIGSPAPAPAASRSAPAPVTRAVLPATPTIPTSAAAATTETGPPPVVPAPAAPFTAAPAALAVIPTQAAATAPRATQCAACLGLTAPTVSQGIVTAIDHAFNNAFDAGDRPTEPAHPRAL